MNRLRGIKSLWCDKERGRVLESVSVCCLWGGLSTPPSHQQSPSVFLLLRVLLYRSNHFISSSPFLYYFGSSRSLSLPFCFYSFPSGAFPFLPLAAHQFLSILLSSRRIPHGKPPAAPASPCAPLLLRPPRLRRAAAGRAERGSLSPRLQPLAPHGSRSAPRPLRSGPAPPSPPVPALPEGGRPGRVVIVTARQRERKNGGASARRA